MTTVRWAACHSRGRPGENTCFLTFREGDSEEEEGDVSGSARKGEGGTRALRDSGKVKETRLLEGKKDREKNTSRLCSHLFLIVPHLKRVGLFLPPPSQQAPSHVNFYRFSIMEVIPHWLGIALSPSPPHNLYDYYGLPKLILGLLSNVFYLLLGDESMVASSAYCVSLPPQIPI
ncbi:hypothetical protein E2C01_073979 [Portunus trituberculatus]|uniref:Uncharacterized protein n=1 Tax=Portunus trituberculatus TaxID=210409 RepID=A0A5B7I267_PORTR|nr:hypothetical protein [Portunus trituberculatus]